MSTSAGRLGACRVYSRRLVFTPLERRVRHFVYRHFVDTARAPALDAIAHHTGEPSDAVTAALRRLADGRALVLAPASSAVWMAHPFSAVPTAYPVEARGQAYWANCAWDAMGVFALLGGPARMTSYCADCAAPLSVELHEGAIAGDGVVHFVVPPRRFWENVAYT
jgi:hypothetical protein